jgi:hypothetical protein
MGFELLDLFKTWEDAGMKPPTLPAPPETVTGDAIIKYLAKIGRPVRPAVLCRVLHISRSTLQSMIARLTYEDPHLAEDDRGWLIYTE